MYIDPAIIAVLLTIGLGGTVTLVAFLVKQLNEHARWMAAANEREKATGQRIRALEVWRDGVSFGRIVERDRPGSSEDT